MTAGIAELERRGIPATVFVTPAYLEGHAFWWDMLTPPNAEGLTDNVRETALTKHRGRQVEIQPPTDAALPRWARCAGTHDLEAALRFDKLSLASHTWSHPNLMRLTDVELANELTTSREWLGRYANRAVSMVSYPYGLADARVWRAAQTAGYTAGFMISGGWIGDQPHDMQALPRLNVPAGVSHAGFAIRAAGMMNA